MACEVLFFGGYIDGDLPRDSTTADYVAGQPVEISANGVKITTATNPEKYLGMMKNDKSEDDKAGPQAADQVSTTDPTSGVSIGVVCGGNKVRLTPGVKAADAATGNLTAPFEFPGTAHAWVEGDQIFVSSNGKWDNQAQTGTDLAFGRVTKAPTSATDSMEIRMYL